VCFAGSLGGSALLLAGSLVVAPGVAASGMTLYVASGGASGNADTSCATAAYTTINAAVSAAAAGDTGATTAAIRLAGNAGTSCTSAWNRTEGSL
jgi:hypothetical protein